MAEKCLFWSISDAEQISSLDLFCIASLVVSVGWSSKYLLTSFYFSPVSYWATFAKNIFQVVSKVFNAQNVKSDTFRSQSATSERNNTGTAKSGRHNTSSVISDRYNSPSAKSNIYNAQTGVLSSRPWKALKRASLCKVDWLGNCCTINWSHLKVLYLLNSYISTLWIISVRLELEVLYLSD